METFKSPSCIKKWISYFISLMDALRENMILTLTTLVSSWTVICILVMPFATGKYYRSRLAPILHVQCRAGPNCVCQSGVWEISVRNVHLSICVAIIHILDMARRPTNYSMYSLPCSFLMFICTFVYPSQAAPSHLRLTTINAINVSKFAEFYLNSDR